MPERALLRDQARTHPAYCTANMQMVSSFAELALQPQQRQNYWPFMGHIGKWHCEENNMWIRGGCHNFHIAVDCQGCVCGVTGSSAVRGRHISMTTPYTRVWIS